MCGHPPSAFPERGRRGCSAETSSTWVLSYLVICRCTSPLQTPCCEPISSVFHNSAERTHKWTGFISKTEIEGTALLARLLRDLHPPLHQFLSPSCGRPALAAKYATYNCKLFIDSKNKKSKNITVL